MIKEMKYERRNSESRKQYNILLDCIRCQGENICEYSDKQFTKNKVCGWYKVILNDVEKINTGELLTFPILNKIIKDEGLEKMLLNKNGN